MKSEFNKCIKCKKYSNKWEKCTVCGKWVCPDCYFGESLCTECMISTKGNELVNEYHVEKKIGAAL